MCTYIYKTQTNNKKAKGKKKKKIGRKGGLRIGHRQSVIMAADVVFIYFSL